jgi:predicted dehydrogenase
VVHQLKKYLHDNATGSIQYIDSTRINLGVYQTDTNVLWDLACHDISIINYLTGEKPVAVRAIGKINPQHEMEDVVYLFLNYASGMLVHINASWASPVKIRKMIIGGEKRMLIYDDIEPTNKLTIYDYGQNTPMDSDKSFLIDYRLGNITMPKCEIQEPLKNVIADFYSGILHNIQPISTGKNALETVRILEAAQQSLLGGGKLVDL